MPSEARRSASLDTSTVFFARDNARLKWPGFRASRPSFLQKCAFGSRETATCSSSRESVPSRQARAASAGNPAQCLMRLKRSSSTAATSCPSESSAAEASPWNALRPRMFTNSVGSALLLLVNGGVDQEPEPEALQKMED